MNASFLRYLAFAAFVSCTLPNVAWAESGGICSVCNLPLDGPAGPEHLVVERVAERIEQEMTRTAVAAERVPVGIKEVADLRPAALWELIRLVRGIGPPTLTTQDQTQARQRKIMLHKAEAPGAVKAIVDADSVEPLADGRAILDVLGELSDPNGGCIGRTMTLILAHKGPGDRDFLDTLTRMTRDGVFQGQHVVVISCVPAPRNIFDADTLRRWLEWQDSALSIGGASSVLVPTTYINPLAFTLAMLRMCNRPDLASTPASPLEMLQRLYGDSSDRLQAILGRARSGAEDALLRNELRDVFGQGATQTFPGPYSPGSYPGDSEFAAI